MLKTMENSMETVEICTRCDTLTNLDISNHYREGSWWFSKKDFTAAFAHWVVKQSPYDAPDITKALVAWDNYLVSFFPKSSMPVVFSFDDLVSLISEEVFAAIPEIEKLNHRKNEEKTGFGPDDDFIDLYALARNVFYMVMREKITQS
jgi:hypothetical protein